MDLAHLILYFLIAAAAGLIGGMLGGGIGLILVPLLIWILKVKGVSSQILMHVAIGSEVAAIILIGTIACYSHQRRQAISWTMFKRMLPGLLVGIVIGALFAGKLTSQHLILIFGIVVLLLAVYVGFVPDPAPKPVRSLHPAAAFVASFLFGMGGSVLGINSFTVPFFKKIGLNIYNAVATALAIGVVLATGVTIMFIIIGWHAQGLPQYSTGYVDWEISIPIAIAGSIFSPLGAKLTHHVPKKFLKLLYALLLAILGIKMVLISTIFTQL